MSNDSSAQTTRDKVWCLLYFFNPLKLTQTGSNNNVGELGSPPQILICLHNIHNQEYITSLEECDNGAQHQNWKTITKTENPAVVFTTVAFWEPTLGDVAINKVLVDWLKQQPWVLVVTDTSAHRTGGVNDARQAKGARDYRDIWSSFTTLIGPGRAASLSTISSRTTDGHISSTLEWIHIQTEAPFIRLMVFFFF